MSYNEWIFSNGFEIYLLTDQRIINYLVQCDFYNSFAFILSINIIDSVKNILVYAEKDIIM
jgi:hypothetical protein